MTAWRAIVLLVVAAWAGGAVAAVDSPLAREAAALAARHPGESGVLLLDSGADALRQRDALIEAARRTIDAQYYIWNADASGRYLAARLVAAADRGVHVRVLLDDINVAGRDADLARLAAHPNVEVRIYNPTPERRGALRLLGFLGDFVRLNRRMHNKSFTVDGAVTIIGGRNIGDEYFDLDPEMNFRDRELLVAGPVVAAVTAGFEAFWASRWTWLAETLATASPSARADDLPSAATAMAALGYRPDPRLGAVVVDQVLPALAWAPARLVVDPPAGADPDASTVQPVAKELTALVAGARREVLVESAYFILGDDSLALAARLHQAGVSLRALTNSLASNDLVTNHSGYARRRPAMLAAGVELHELRPDAAACRALVEWSLACTQGPAFSLHSKSMVIDRKTVYVGSFNLNLRSTYLNSETALIVESPELAQRIAASMERLFEPDSSWLVRQRPGGGLEWVTASDGRPARTEHEPMVGLTRRLESRVLRLFPLEKYL